AVLLWTIVWLGAVAALYQAAVVLAGFALATGAVQLVLRRGTVTMAASKTVGFVVTLLLIAEAYPLTVYLTRAVSSEPLRFRDSDRTMTRDSILLGYRPDTDDGAVRARRTRADGSVIYDVTYTFRGGLRVTRGDPDGPCTVVFMMDSFAFGEGLN